MEANDPNRKQGRTFSSIVVEPFKQMKFGLYVIAISIVFVAITAGVFIYSFNKQYEHVMEIFNVVDSGAQWDLVTNNVVTSNAILLGVVLVLYIVILMFVVFSLTHKYYGPIVSIQRFIDNINAGDYYQRVSIRNKDELADIVHKLNDMADTLQRRHGARVNDDGSARDRNDRRND